MNKCLLLTVVSLLSLLLAACVGTTVEMVDVPIDNPTEAELCSFDRDPDYPCVSAEGRGMHWGECCAVNGNLGTCETEDADGGPLQIPWCNTAE